MFLDRFEFWPKVSKIQTMAGFWVISRQFQIFADKNWFEYGMYIIGYKMLQYVDSTKW